MQLSMYSVIYTLIRLLHITQVAAVIDTWQDGFFGEFSVINHGRMDHHTVLMFLPNVGLEECINFCMKHRQCVSVSYSKYSRECELNDMKFDELEADPNAVGWMNYYRPPMIHGKFSDWKLMTPCSTTCGSGFIVFYRQCDNPRPQYGGDQCEGPYEKTEPCEQWCPLGENVAIGKPSSQISTYNDREDCKAYNANDGKLDTRSATSYAYPPRWWQVDLQEVIKIRLINLFFVKYAFEQKYYPGLKVLTKVDRGSTFSLCETVGTPMNLQVNVTCDKKNTKAQYIRVEVHGGKRSLYLHEVEVYEWN